MEEKSVPRELLQSLKNVEQFDEKSFLYAHEHRAQVVSVRINPKKSPTLRSRAANKFRGAAPDIIFHKDLHLR